MVRVVQKSSSDEPVNQAAVATVAQSCSIRHPLHHPPSGTALQTSDAAFWGGIKCRLCRCRRTWRLVVCGASHFCAKC
jgi:hypothetical protein